jgi:uncharacterized protein
VIAVAERTGDWMVTATGRQYWPLDPRAEDVCIEDIATHLSKECRFAGACRGFYSVAEHSVLVSQVVPQEHALQALLHDAPEAYVKDIPRPLKRGLGSTYADIEELNWLAICDAMGIGSILHPCVKAADDAVLLAERDALMPEGGPRWEIESGVGPVLVTVRGLEWHEARALFLQRYRELTHRIP